MGGHICRTPIIERTARGGLGYLIVVVYGFLAALEQKSRHKHNETVGK